jgi:hypothetical protein
VAQKKWIDRQFARKDVSRQGAKALRQVKPGHGNGRQERVWIDAAGARFVAKAVAGVSVGFDAVGCASRAA